MTFDEVGVTVEIRVQIVDVGQIAAFGHVTLFGEQFEDAAGRFLNELDAGRIVGEGDVRELDLFGQVELLFQGKHVVIEEAVQFLVGVVDAQLFEWIATKVLKAKDVQNAQETVSVLSRARAPVDVIQQPGKCSRIQHSGHGMSIFSCLQNKYK